MLQQGGVELYRNPKRAENDRLRPKQRRNELLYHCRGCCLPLSLVVRMVTGNRRLNSALQPPNQRANRGKTLLVWLFFSSVRKSVEWGSDDVFDLWEVMIMSLSCLYL